MCSTQRPRLRKRSIQVALWVVACWHGEGKEKINDASDNQSNKAKLARLRSIQEVHAASKLSPASRPYFDDTEPQPNHALFASFCCRVCVGGVKSCDHNKTRSAKAEGGHSWFAVPI
ncbi:hypothetical protein DOTSEDRAFT_69018 [Dothistroma septosporum NZE10]|uniref:Uncharacterized protein n=1 Tax=Dothistroma septosporum (strain NZE10 / CBS 128990) TaxID=675120 RepID=N1Q5H3_DOTSN|nr:hypothetical protein DOTSEDRAFT_69018 [Dothistroma septosporum NZE10]